MASESTNRSRIKRLLAKHELAALWTARARSQWLGLLAFSLRLRFCITAYLPWSVKLVGIRRIAIGRNTVIGSQSWLNVNDRNGEGHALRIGRNCFIGAGNFFTVGKAVEIGDYCLTARGCSFVGATHVYDDPMRPYLDTGVTCNHEIRVGANCFFGLGAQVIGHVAIGHGSVIGAGAVVRDDVPPFSLVVGNPARVIKRFDFAEKKWVKWPAVDYSEGPSEADYLAHLHRTAGAPVHHISAAAGALRDVS